MFNKKDNLYWTLIILLVIVFSVSNITLKIAKAVSQPENPHRRRILVIAPHPDDEILSCAKVISEALNNGEKIKVLLMTNGDIPQFPTSKNPYKGFITNTGVHDVNENGYIDNVDYCYQRQEETIKADIKLGLDAKDIIFLGYPGGNLWRLYNFGYNGISFDIGHPFDTAFALNPGTGFVSPYKNAYHSLTNSNNPTVHSRSYIINDLKDIFRNFKPTDIYAPIEFDDNSNHKSTTIFIRVALQELKDSKEEFAFNVRLHRYLIHFSGNNISYPDPNNPKLGLRNDKNCEAVKWEDTKIGMAPNGSIQLDSDFKKLKHEIIDYYSTQYPRKKILQPPCNRNTEVLWMHQYVKDREEWWDLPLEIDTDFPIFEKLSLKDKTLFFLKKLFH